MSIGLSSADNQIIFTMEKKSDFFFFHFNIIGKRGHSSDQHRPFLVIIASFTLIHLMKC